MESEMNTLILVTALVGMLSAVVVTWRRFRERLDRIRIQEYLAARGCRWIEMEATDELSNCSEGRERDYRLVYEDSAGNAHDVYCRTSMWSGVFFTDDRLQRLSPATSDSTSPTDDQSRLRTENEQLRAEIARLTSESAQHND